MITSQNTCVFQCHLQFPWTHHFIHTELTLNDYWSHQTWLNRYWDKKQETLQTLHSSLQLSSGSAYSAVVTRWKTKQKAATWLLLDDLSASKAQKLCSRAATKHAKSLKKGRKWVSNKVLVIFAATLQQSILEMRLLQHQVAVLTKFWTLCKERMRAIFFHRALKEEDSKSPALWGTNKRSTLPFSSRVLKL